MRITITSVRPPMGIGPGQIIARKMPDNQTVKVVVSAHDWALFMEAGAAVGDTVEYDAETRAWHRA